MKNLINHTILALLLLLMSIILFLCSPETKDNRKFSLTGDGWLIKSSTQVSEEGEIISTGKFQPLDWHQASVPTTVLSALVKDGIYPDPRIGLNNFKIPDASDEINERYELVIFSHLGDGINPWKASYWFRKEFELPASYNGKNIWLNFNGINYRADVWLNGHKIAGRDKMVGMFLRFRYDITEYANVNETNCLAIRIYQVDHPGTPWPGAQFKVFGRHRGESVDIFKDETLRFSGGTDCAPLIRDRNMGIYQDVYITATGKVSIEDPFVVTDLLLPDTSRADIRIATVLTNHKDEEVKGLLTAKISLMDTLKFPTYAEYLGGSMPDIVVSKEVILNANQSLDIELSPKNFSELTIKNPYLWWPNGYGKQYLHNLELTFYINNKISDQERITFGIREIENKLKKIGDEYGRVFYVNGERIFCRGGWLQPPSMLEQNEKRVYDEARLLAKANVNMVANEDAPSPPDIVLDAYDKYGILIWETFYGCWRMYPGKATANNPLDHDLAIREGEDIIKRYRNHPSLALWCVACETTVTEDIYTSLRKNAIKFDGTRPFAPSSNISWDVDSLTPYIKADLPLGMSDHGEPGYNWNPEPYYFEKVLEVNLQTFRNELGAPSVPVYSSLKKFIPKFNEDVDSPIFPLDSVWSEHGAIDRDEKFRIYSTYDNAIRARYGKPSSVKDYARKAQYVNANSYRAMYEAYNHRMWDITSGVMLWKLNATWPTVLWQLYDWFLCQNASYYFAQSAMEPVHIQMNANGHKISVINRSYQELEDAKICAKVINFNMKEIWSQTDTATIGADRYQEFFTIPQALSETMVYFVKLELKDKYGNILSENMYWKSLASPPNFKVFSKLKPVALGVSTAIKDIGNEIRVLVTLRNSTNKLSFFNRLVITQGKNGKEVLPVFWDKNFITLFPGEEKMAIEKKKKKDLHEGIPFFQIDDNKKIEPMRLESALH